MNTVHPGRNKYPVQHALDGEGHAHVAVMEEGPELKGDLIDNQRREGGADQQNLGCAESSRESNLDKMKTERRADVEIRIDMVHIVISPQEGNPVVRYMPVIEAQIQERGDCRRLRECGGRGKCRGRNGDVDQKPGKQTLLRPSQRPRPFKQEERRVRDPENRDGCSSAQE
jgi:hypothetical protein